MLHCVLKKTTQPHTALMAAWIDTYVTHFRDVGTSGKAVNSYKNSVLPAVFFFLLFLGLTVMVWGFATQWAFVIK